MKLTKSYVLCALSLLFTVLVQAQDSTVRGTVKDESGAPLPGASVILKNTSRGTTTDFDGNFEIGVPSDGTLVFSYVGYTPAEETIAGRSQIEVTLQPDVSLLDEIVVVGYGTQKKSVVTGAISGVKEGDLQDLPINRVEQSLQGRASGITIAANSGQPGAASTIRVRGITTLNNNEPLWVVDGVIVDAGGIGYLNQSDVASIEVLKDAASAAIYGSRAAAGVILVTTKSGKSGKLSVNYNGYTGISAPARKLDLLNAAQYATLRNEASVAGGGSILFPNPDSYGKGTDWQEQIFSNSAKRENHEISVSGGTEKSTFYASFGYLDQEGIVVSDISHYIRKNFRLNSTHQINDYIRVGQTFGYSNEKNAAIDGNTFYGGPLSSAVNLDPITPAIETDPAVLAGVPYVDGTGSLRPDLILAPNGFPYGISTLVGQEMTNPLAFTKTRLGNHSWSDNFVGNAYVEVEPIENLRIRSTFGGKLAYWGGESFNPVAFLTSSFVTSQNSLSRNTNKGFGWNIENTASYNKALGGHDFTVLLGQGVYVDNITEGQSITYNNIPVNNYKDASFNFDIPTEQINASAYTGVIHKVTSLFARLNYAFQEKYLFTGIVRRDGSSRFGSNNKFGIFPSFSAGWVANKENFWPENNIVNQLKIRGSYGVTGSDQIGDFKYLSTIGDGRNYAVGNTGSVVIGNSPDAPANPDLKWEETSQTNIGLDATLFNGLNVTFDWYYKKTTGILRDVPLPGYVGATGSPAGNVADMENKGVDLGLSYNKSFGDLRFSLSGNMSTVHNEVTFLGEGVEFLSGGTTVQASTFPITRTQVGQPVNSFFGFVTDGIFQNQAEIDAYVNSEGQPMQPVARPGDFRWKDVDGDGSITDNDRDFIGSSIPKVTFGINLNVNYKNFDLLVFAQGAAGNKIFQALRRLDIGSANFQTSALGRWSGEGSSNTFPRLTTNDTNKNFTNPSDFYLEDGDYLRFKTIQFGYTLPQDVLGKVGISKIRLYVTGENLITFTKYTGFDPEIGGNVFGIDRGYYPQARTGMLGINLQF
ncbi:MULTISPECIES: SusC/RagA family TonB-linked outer membrane protein [Flagellimonas]|uniref:TonB-dependent receptor n=1 Tax=Flagellimonas hadalis TaxID=2597517 RepID=A0A5N5IW43_9FLAO|nr:TonB-dependent receptor [Allomuricauda hadalis]KAB5487649.1 TonB-dependent receptor [Allomuricauda hadalis]